MPGTGSIHRGMVMASMGNKPHGKARTGPAGCGGPGRWVGPGDRPGFHSLAGMDSAVMDVHECPIIDFQKSTQTRWWKS